MTQFTCKGVKQINNRISLNMTFTFTIRISRRFSSAQEFQMGNFQKYWLQNVGQDFFVHLYLIFFTGGRFWKLSGRKGPSKSGEKGSLRKVHMYACDEIRMEVQTEHFLDLLYLVITSIIFFSSIVNFFQNFVQYWYTSNVIKILVL